MIKNIIFDMGNVIIDIDVPTTYRAFADMAGISEEEATQRFHAKDFYHRFEIGEITNEEFRSLMKNEFGENLTGDQIDVAWSALLLDMPKERLHRIQELGKSYRVFLLSNTNAIHIKEVTERAANLGYNFSGLFEKMFLSYQMGFMKPEPAFYEEVLKNSGLVASETVFIDDNAYNIKGAESLGIQTIWLSPIGSMLDKLSEF